MAALCVALLDCAAAPVTCNRFQINHVLSEDSLMVSIDTDLPDVTVVMVGVSRSYYEKGSTEEYPLSYFDQKSTIGAWRANRRIDISDSKWQLDLQERQRKTAAAGIGFELGRVSPTIDISFTVPVNQPDPRFGTMNRNLTGSLVDQSKPMRTIQADVKLPRPLTTPTSREDWASGDALKVGERYRVEREVPLMPELNPVDPIAAIARIQKLPAGTVITIKQIATRDGASWYRITAVPGANAVATGWLNSGALIGQTLQVVR